MHGSLKGGGGGEDPRLLPDTIFLTFVFPVWLSNGLR